MTQLEYENLHPVRYVTLEDAELNRNPIHEGEPGYEEAQFEQRFVLLPS